MMNLGVFIYSLLKKYSNHRFYSSKSLVFRSLRSNISISTDNSDSSVNNSNNTIYDNSTTITNVVDNCTTINNDISQIMEELKKLSEQSSNKGEILISLKLLDVIQKNQFLGVKFSLIKKSLVKVMLREL